MGEVTFAPHLVGSLRRNYPACSRLPTAPEAEFQDTANSQDTHNLQLSRAYIKSGKAQSYLLPGLPHPSLSRGASSLETDRTGLRGGRSRGQPQRGELSAREETQLRQMVPLLESELRQGTGPRAGAPCRRKTLLLGTFSSKQSPEPPVPAATEEWSPPRDRAGAQMLRAITSFHALNQAQPRLRTDNKRSPALLHRLRTTISPTSEPKPVAGHKQPYTSQPSLALEGRTLSPSPSNRHQDPAL